MWESLYKHLQIFKYYFLKLSCMLFTNDVVFFEVFRNVIEKGFIHTYINAIIIVIIIINITILFISNFKILF